MIVIGVTIPEKRTGFRRSEQARADDQTHGMITDERPTLTLRDRLLRHGEDGLSDLDLLAVLLGSGTRDGEALDLAWRLIRRFGSLRNLDRADVDDVLALSGVGPARLARVKAGLELARRAAAEPLEQRPCFAGSRQIFEFLHLAMRELEQEVFDVVLVDAKNRLLGQRRISVGTLTGSLVHPREVFRPAIVVGAAALVLVHNHPSGDPTPSREDLDVTERIVLAGDILGIRVLDHLVIGDGRYVSLADTGRLREGASR